MRFGVDPGPEPDVPIEVEAVWEHFWEISRRRVNSENGPQPISFTEIDAWCRMTGNALSSESVEMLTAMDNAFIAAMAKELREAREAKEEEQKRRGRRKR